MNAHFLPSEAQAFAGVQLELFGAAPDTQAFHEAPKSRHDSRPANANMPALDQLDLFIHTPFDQALSGVRRALLVDDFADAASSLALAHALAGKSAKDGTESATQDALVDAEHCLKLWQRRDFGTQGLADWQWLSTHNDALARFLGPTSAPMIARFWHVLAESPQLACFQAAQPSAYAAQIYFDLAEFDLAHAVLAQDSGASTCPQRLQLWIQVSSARSAVRGDDADLSSLRHWQTLCFDWPEQAEEALTLSRRFAREWANFCDLDGDQKIANFPGFACLLGVVWPAPERQDQHPGAVFLRAVQALNGAQDSVQLRLGVKTLVPEMYQSWLEKYRVVR
jgi:hypothetical protein